MMRFGAILAVAPLLFISTIVAADGLLDGSDRVGNTAGGDLALLLEANTTPAPVQDFALSVLQDNITLNTDNPQAFREASSLQLEKGAQALTAILQQPGTIENLPPIVVAAVEKSVHLLEHASEIAMGIERRHITVNSTTGIDAITTGRRLSIEGFEVDANGNVNQQAKPKSGPGKKNEQTGRAKPRTPLKLNYEAAHPRVRQYAKYSDALMKGDESLLKHADRLFHKEYTPPDRRKNGRRLASNAATIVGAEADCEELVKCLQSWTLNDVIVFFFHDDITETGEFKTTNNFDAEDVIAKADQISIALSAFNSQNVRATKDLPGKCNTLQRLFYTAKEKTGYTEHKSATWREVCRGEGGTRYVKFQSVEKKFGKLVANSLFENFVSCATHIKGGEHVFFQQGTGAPQLPIAQNFAALDQFGKVMDPGSVFAVKSIDLASKFRSWVPHFRTSNVNVVYLDSMFSAGCNNAINTFYKDYLLGSPTPHLVNNAGAKRQYPQLTLDCPYHATNRQTCRIIAAGKELCKSHIHHLMDTSWCKMNPWLDLNQMQTTLTSPVSTRCNGNACPSNAYTLYDGVTDDQQPHFHWATNKCDSSQTPFVDIILGQTIRISALKIFNYYSDSRAFCGQRVQLSNNGWQWETVFDTGTTRAEDVPPSKAEGNEIVLDEPKLINRIRYSVGKSTVSDWAHITEIKVKLQGFQSNGDTCYVSMPVENVLSSSAAENDVAANLLLGDKVSKGLICAHRKPPGYCCLDDTNDSFTNGKWGTQFDCAGGQQSCRKLGPALSGFSEESCKIYSGTYCPHPRDCSSLTQCVAEQITFAAEHGKDAYGKYLTDAPEVKETSDLDQCGELREYFGFDHDFPDDGEICQDIKYLQNHKRFDELDAFAAADDAANGPSTIDAATAAPTSSLKDIMDPGEDEHADLFNKWFNNGDTSAAQIKAENTKEMHWEQAMTSSEEFFDLIDMMECSTGNIACFVIKSILVAIMRVAWGVMNRIFIFNKYQYGEEKTMSDYQVTDMFECIKHAHNNKKTLVENQKALQSQLSQMATFNEGQYNDYFGGGNVPAAEAAFPKLRSTADGIKSELAAQRIPIDFDATKDKVLDLETAVNGAITANCGVRRLTEKTKHLQKFSGCDGSDNDGDGINDNCEEDQYPPEIAVPWSPTGFKGFGGHYKLQGQWFTSMSSAFSYIRDAVNIEDDCAERDALDLSLSVVEMESDSCGTIVNAVPIHKNACNGKNQTGLLKEFHMLVDEEPPNLACSFGESSSHLLSSDKKTLFVKEDGKMFDPGFSYQVRDSCADHVDIEVSVKSNERSTSSPMAVLMEAATKDGSVLPKILLSQMRCQRGTHGCFRGGFTDFKFYDIIVSATDAAGWTTEDTCRVVIIPKQQTEQQQQEGLLRGGSLALPMGSLELEKLVTSSSFRNHVGSLSIQHNLS